MKHILISSLCGALLLSACGKTPVTPASQPETLASKSFGTAVPRNEDLDAVAARFVVLALSFGPYDKNYVDAYTGPDAVKANVEANPLTLVQVKAEAKALMKDIKAIDLHPSHVARAKLLEGDLRALQTRLRMLEGEKLSFNEETRLLYDAVAPQYTEADFVKALAAYDAALPGEGSVNERAAKLREQLVVAPDKIQYLMETAINECRERTKAHYVLPEGERFDLEFVRDKPWSAYNWYKGDYVSLIEVNLDQPFSVGRAIELGCHEGYPGHHLFNILAEEQRINEKGWIEATVQPLFSPAGPIMEGSGNYGVELAFPGEKKPKYEAEVLYPLAGIDPKLAYVSYEANKAFSILSHVQTHVAREYLDGRMSREEAVAFKMKYELQSRSRSEQSVDFIETYRGYVINYALGQDVIRDYVERKVAAGADPWDVFKYILETPVSVQDLVED